MMMMILFLSMQKMRADNQLVKLSMLNAYVLALFSHFVTKLLGDVYFCINGPESMAQFFEDEPKILENGDDMEEKTEAPKAAKKRVKDFFRRRRRRSTSDSSSSESSDESASSDSDSSSERDSSDSSSDNSEDDDDDVIVEDTTDIVTTLEIVKLVGGHHLIQAIRLCSLWLMESQDILKESGDTSAILWVRLSKIFNAISLDNPALETSPSVEEARRGLAEDVLQIPLQEDFLLKGTSLAVLRQEAIRWSESGEISIEQKGVIRILQLQELGQWLCKIPHSRIGVKETKFFVKPKEEALKSEASKLEKTTEHRREIMENMAQLWLEQEVRDLEGKHSDGFGHCSPYIVVDHWALTRDVNLLKDVVSTKQFVVIVPAATVQELDRMKRNETGARNAIRWLERQFKEGNRWVRAQRSHEIKQLEESNKKNLWSYNKILECCYFFSHGYKKQEGPAPVTLIIGREDDLPSENTIFQLAETIRKLNQLFL